MKIFFVEDILEFCNWLIANNKFIRMFAWKLMGIETEIAHRVYKLNYGRYMVLLLILKETASTKITDLINLCLIPISFSILGTFLAISI